MLPFIQCHHTRGFADWGGVVKPLSSASSAGLPCERRRALTRCNTHEEDDRTGQPSKSALGNPHGGSLSGHSPGRLPSRRHTRHAGVRRDDSVTMGAECAVASKASGRTFAAAAGLFILAERRLRQRDVKVTRSDDATSDSRIRAHTRSGLAPSDSLFHAAERRYGRLARRQSGLPVATRLVTHIRSIHERRRGTARPLALRRWRCRACSSGAAMGV